MQDSGLRTDNVRARFGQRQEENTLPKLVREIAEPEALSGAEDKLAKLDRD